MSPGDGENHWAVVNTAFARIDGLPRPSRASYTWSVLHAADIARRTGVPRISVLEIGVAGGNGLVALEIAAEEAEAAFGVGIDVYGLDTGRGLPSPVDHRDAPFIMEQGDFPMDAARLRERLSRAELVLGELHDTVAPFVASGPAPIGFVSFDLDFYSSTRDALELLRAGADLFLPRVLCYFDDVLGYPWGASNGARLALDEFNAAATDRRIDHLPGMRYLMPAEVAGDRWTESLYLAHLHDHERYADFEGTHVVRRLDLADG